MKILVADDSKFYQANTINIITTNDDDVEIESVHRLSEIEAMVESGKLGEFDILLLDLYFPDGRSIDILPILRETYPDLFIISVSGQNDIRIALQILDAGADSYVCKSDALSADLYNALKIAYKHVTLQKKNKALLNTIFDKRNFPMVVFKFDQYGVSPIYRDFEHFPEYLTQSTETFLINLGVSISMALRGDNEYIEGVFTLPAGSSKTFETLVASLRIHDKTAKDARLKLGLVLVCVFIPFSSSHLLPRVKNIEFITEILKSQIGDLADFDESVAMSWRDIILDTLRSLIL